MFAPGGQTKKESPLLVRQDSTAGRGGAGLKVQMSILPNNKGPDPSVKMMELIEIIFQDEKEIERDVLKELLESIVNELKSNGDKIHKVDMKLVSKYMVFEK